jgi:ABC-type sugar transport system permease subunit
VANTKSIRTQPAHLHRVLSFAAGVFWVLVALSERFIASLPVTVAWLIVAMAVFDRVFFGTFVALFSNHNAEAQQAAAVVQLVKFHIFMFVVYHCTLWVGDPQGWLRSLGCDSRFKPNLIGAISRSE